MKKAIVLLMLFGALLTACDSSSDSTLSSESEIKENSGKNNVVVSDNTVVSSNVNAEVEAATVHSAEVDLNAIGGDSIYWDYNFRYMYIPADLALYVGQDVVDSWIEARDWDFNLQEFVEHFNLTSDEIIQVLNLQETTDNPDLYLTVSDAEILCSGNQAEINRTFASDLAAVSDNGSIYTIFWLAEHDAEDYQAAGLSESAVQSAIDNCAALGLDTIDSYISDAEVSLNALENLEG